MGSKRPALGGVQSRASGRNFLRFAVAPDRVACGRHITVPGSDDARGRSQLSDIKEATVRSAGPLRKCIATVALSGTLRDKLEACASVGFDGVEIMESDLLTSRARPRTCAASAKILACDR